MSEIKIGVVTDSRMGGFDNQITEALKREGLDVLTFLGDAPRQHDAPAQEHFDHLATTLQTYDKVDVPIFWIPGNYEDFNAYFGAFAQLGDDLNNVVDATRLGGYALKINGVEVDLVFVPGARDFSRGFRVREDLGPTGNYPNGKDRIHVYNPNDLGRLVTRPDKTILLCHNPPAMDADNTFDVSIRADYQGREIAGPGAEQLIREGRARPKIVHAGNELVGRIIDKIDIQKVLSGDIHGAVYTTDRQGKPIPAGTFSRELFGNPGPARDGRYGVLVYRDDGMATLYSKSVRGAI